MKKGPHRPVTPLVRRMRDECRRRFHRRRNFAGSASVEGLNADPGVTKMLRLFTMTAILAVGPMAAPPVFAQTTPPGHTAASSAKEALDQQDKNFIKEASIGGMAEVELSKMAQKSENADVKRFAARMIEDHSKANEQMATVAAALGIEPPKALDFRARAAAREAPDVARQGLRRSVYAGYGRGPRQGGEALRGGGTLRSQR